MNKEWSEQNKSIQLLIKKEVTFKEGIEALLNLREKLMEEISSWRAELRVEDFSAMPFMNANGYHNKTIAYSLWHVFRIEDIVAHSLINGDEQIIFSKNYQQRISSPIITTGNELVKEQIAEFSRQLDIDELYRYITEVKNSTDDILKKLAYSDLKRKMTQRDKDKLQTLHVVSTDEAAIWLIDYWCGKDVKGLIQMPFSRHWIMHVEACVRIKEKV